MLSFHFSSSYEDEQVMDEVVKVPLVQQKVNHMFRYAIFTQTQKPRSKNIIFQVTDKDKIRCAAASENVGNVSGTYLPNQVGGQYVM